ncbi:MAG: flagellar hook-basal body complex protein [Pseudobutyrivibrio ruminis]|jgi:flagellar hook protein FlgE|uniref:flagellar hook protein FlgE n=1 Tax=Pseudobutyrivibrio ruminis TaxID=46206 RepID=UPI0026EA2B17|nr:flagellar hook-basal body complex protein [Pseudobutyrivibrio ruminis]MBE5914190.1 flagellar hook-basal body complex protein [Pseudobutyrivibrio ruminis]
MMRSLFSGVAGLKTHQTKMDVIGNNISNVNTVAFKSSSTTFSDIMYQTTSQASGATENRGGTNAKQIGLGVTNGATKISITSSGAAQSTGDALDIRLSDTNSTNFFIVNNGSENVFTRAGSFYIDGNGNLAMTTTGYLVMGWQTDTSSGTPVIVQDTVSPLRVMAAENLTSAPEATTQANFSGVIDKNDTQFSSTNGYVRSFTIYDNLGYSYTAKFSFKLVNGTTGEYTVELTNLYDQDNNDLLASYVANGGNKSDIFGTTNPVDHTYSATDGSNYTFGTTTTGDLALYINGDTTAPYLYDAASQTFSDGTTSIPLTSAVSGLSTDDTVTGVAYASDSTLTITTTTISYDLKFDTSKGNLTYAGENGQTQLVMNTSLLGPNVADAALSNITIDFSLLTMYDNGGTSTAVGNRGTTTDASNGAGKKLGTMTGLSVSSNGEIYGSYSNGNTVLLGQIPVAQFANASGLEEMGDNCYKTTLNSGEFDGIGLVVSADGSAMNTGQLEMSNVDLSAEFTDMITTQRGFQANSRIITVSDTMLEELINLKR